MFVGFGLVMAVNLWRAQGAQEVVSRVETVAGVSSYEGSKTEPKSPLSYPRGVTIDRQGILYVADTGNKSVRKVTPKGEVATFGEEGKFQFPSALTFDAQGNLYVLDGTTVHVLDSQGKARPLATITTRDVFDRPSELAVDPQGNVFVGGNYGSIHLITPDGKVSALFPLRALIPEGAPMLIEGYTVKGLAVSAKGTLTVAVGDPFGSGARFLWTAQRDALGQWQLKRLEAGRAREADGASPTQPSGSGIIALAPNGNLFVAETTRIRCLTTAGQWLTIAGTDRQGYRDGPATTATFSHPKGMVFAPDGSLYLTDYNSLRRVTHAGKMASIGLRFDELTLSPWSGAQLEPTVIGVPEEPLMWSVNGVLWGNEQVGMISPQGLYRAPSQVARAFDVTIEVRSNYTPTACAQATLHLKPQEAMLRPYVVTLAGNDSVQRADYDTLWERGGVDGSRGAAQLPFPLGMAVDDENNAYTIDRRHSRLRKIAPDGSVSTIQVSGRWSLGQESTMARAPDGSFYASGYSQVWRITPDGQAESFAGLRRMAAERGYRDGPKEQALFEQPRVAGVDAAGNVYVQEVYGHRLRRIASDGMVSTLAITKQVLRPDDKPVVVLERVTRRVAVKRNGDVLLPCVDYKSSAEKGFTLRLHRLTPKGEMSQLAAFSVTESRPPSEYAEALLSADERFLYLVDIGKGFLGVVRLGATEQESQFQLIAPTREREHGSIFADGIWATARFNSPNGVALDRDGNLLIADTQNHRIRKVLLPNALALTAPKDVQEGDARWTRHTIDNSSRGADGVRLADANSDGLLDIATGWEQGGKIRVYLHPGHAKAKEKWQAVTVGEVGDPEDAVFADVDGDGTVDVVSCCEGKTQSVFVHWAPKDKAKYLDPTAWTTEAFPAVQGKRWMFCLPMQVDGKRGIDLVMGGKDEGAQIGWLESPNHPRNLSEWKWHPITDVGWVMSLIAWDVNRDGDQDVITTDRKGAMRGCYWLENPGAQPSQGWKKHLIGGAGREVMFAVARSVGSEQTGLFDVLTCAKERDVVFLRRESPDPNAWKEFIIPFPGSTGRAKGVNVADINLDGKPDIVFSCESAGGDKSGVAWMSYRENFTEPTWDFHDISGFEGVKFDLVALHDVDGDGDLDVLTTEEVDNLGVIWYENPTRKGRG
jgi:sugar lactone lactonase YvrE